MANLTGQKLTHMTHAEDLVLLGKDGMNLALNTLKDVFNYLRKEEVTSSVKVKWDGSPSIIAATNWYGNRFVATKGFFAKNPKYATTEEECQELYGHSPELLEKMILALRYLDKINIPKDEVWQGDFLFKNSDLINRNINDVDYLTFQANTLIYAVPYNSDIADEMRNSLIGITWHTRYRGYSIDNLEISFDASIDELGQCEEVFQLDARIPEFTANLISDTEEVVYRSHINDIEEKVKDLSNSKIFEEVLDEKVTLLLNTFRNHVIKTKDSEDVVVDEFIDWINARYQKQIDEKKTQKSKDRLEAEREEIVTKIVDNKAELEYLLSLQEDIRWTKGEFTDILDNINAIHAFVQTVDGEYQKTGQEGYAVSDKVGNVQKYVRRDVFSRNNFSPNIRKGWSNERRDSQMSSN